MAGTVTVDKLRSGKGLQGWATEDRLLDYYGQRICGVLHGGHNARHGTHLVASGNYTPEVVAVVRECWPDHLVSRADVALDLDGPGCWDKLETMLLDVSRRRGLKWRTIGDFREDRDELAGRTIYLGSRQSPVFIRCYEKGKQLLASRRVGDLVPSLEHCRIEVEVKPPTRAAKISSAKLTPAEFCGCSPGSREVFSRVSELELERIYMTARKESDAHRAVRHMAVQYRLAMQEVMSAEGGEPGLMTFIREVWNQQDDETA